jgi:hypothetical protein
MGEKDMKHRHAVIALFAALFSPSATAADLCAGKQPGSISFYNAEVDRDKALPPAATQLVYSKPMFAVLCLSDAVGPQPPKGTKFRIVLWINGKQFGVFRPELSKPRKDIIIDVKEDFGDRMGYMIDAGTHKLRLQGATEKVTDKVDVTLDFKNDVAYFQRLRAAGYVADGEIALVK